MNLMMKKSKLTISLLGMVILSFIGCGTSDRDTSSRVDKLPYYNEATFTPIWLEENSSEIEYLHQIGSFKFINQEGDTITEQTFAGKIYVTDFFFTICPGICPKMTANMRVLQEAFLEDEDVLLLSHSVTPQIDSVPTLKRYAENKGIISGKWHLVTGNRDAIYKMGRMEYFVEENLGQAKSPDEFLHTENFVLIDQDRHIRGIYNGLNKSSVNQLIADIKTLKATY